jgi:hypothetical protein
MSGGWSSAGLHISAAMLLWLKLLLLLLKLTWVAESQHCLE